MSSAEKDAARSWAAQLETARNNPRPMARDISLVIPTLGRAVLADCLGAVLEGSAWPVAVIVVDQGPSEQIASWLDDLGGLGIDARHERCKGRGRALGLNIGLRLVTTRFVVITDDDCRPGAGWIEG